MGNNNVYEFIVDEKQMKEMRERLEKPGITQEYLDYCKEKAKKYRNAFK